MKRKGTSIAYNNPCCVIATILLVLFTKTKTFALTQGTTTTAIRVCTGSSCLGKCRGAFDPKKSLEELQKSATSTSTTTTDNTKNISNNNIIEIEEVFCMNQCKRGPNMRIIKNGHVITFEDKTIMNDMELTRKSFQNVRNDERVAMVWGLAEGLVDGSIVGIEDGLSTKLTDMIPVR